MELKGKDVPIGDRIEINGRVYECVKELREGFCDGCDLFSAVCLGRTVCTEDCRKDGQGVIFKEVKK